MYVHGDVKDRAVGEEAVRDTGEMFALAPWCQELKPTGWYDTLRLGINGFSFLSFDFLSFDHQRQWCHGTASSSLTVIYKQHQTETTLHIITLLAKKYTIIYVWVCVCVSVYWYTETLRHNSCFTGSMGSKAHTIYFVWEHMSACFVEVILCILCMYALTYHMCVCVCVCVWQ